MTKHRVLLGQTSHKQTITFDFRKADRQKANGGFVREGYRLYLLHWCPRPHASVVVAVPVIVVSRQHYGIPEYWILDPELAQVKIYRLIDGRYGQAAVLTLEAQDTLTTPLLLNLSLPLATLFT